MSGHSKWANIKHRKGAQDAKRAKIFSRVSKNIILAAQIGGADIEANYTLKSAIEAARKVNMPKDNIERAIKFATGGDNTARIEEIIYEAMGPAGSSMIILCATDNTNRSLTDVKTALKKNEGKFVSGGGVLFNYEHVGIICLTSEDTESAEIHIIESGALDYEFDSDDVSKITIYTELSNFQSTQRYLEDLKYTISSADLIYKPKQTIELDDSELEIFEKIYDALDEVDDVQEIFTNLE